MKKRFVSFVVILAVLMTMLSAVSVSAEDLQTGSKAALQIKNVIYLIPDGGGYGPYDFANMVKQAGGFDAAKYPNKTATTTEPMTMRDYLAGSLRTKSANNSITDSAAAGTALATGYKTNNGYIGVNPGGKPIANLVEAAQSVGKATGLIATYEWMHATPASFSAHAIDRNDYKNLYQQIENQGIEVVLGTGYGAVSSYATIQNAVDRGYTVINNKTQLNDVEPGDKLWGNMAQSMPYDINLSSSQATLAEMTKAAITALSGDEDGFFLMVEGSKVDSGGHSNDAVVTTSEYLAFDAAFKVAVDFAKGRNDTVVICAPDHDTGGMQIKTDMSAEVAQVQKGTDPSSISWSSTNHTNQNGGVWMYVPEGVSVIDGLNSTLGDTADTRSNYVVENTALAPYVADLFEVDLDELTEDLFVDVTDIGNYINGRFQFYSGKIVYPNQSVYYDVSGTETDTDGQVSVYINGKFYVPSVMLDDSDWAAEPAGSGEFSGSGTQSDPYLIANANDFIAFTDSLLAENTYSGKYFKQTTNLDLAGNGAYTGMGSTATFAGIYDGGGHTININITSPADKCVFGYVTGTIMNLGITGSITSTGASSTYASVVRSLREGGKMVNCYSNADINGYNAAGLVWSNYGSIINCYFGGTVYGSYEEFPIARKNSNSCIYKNCYYVSGCGASQNESGTSSITSSAATSTLAETLNGGRQVVATALGIDIDGTMSWKQENGGLPYLYYAEPIVTNVTVTPNTATLSKGDSLQLSATVIGENNPSQEVIWYLEPESSLDGTGITENGLLTIDEKETRTSFTVMAKSKQNGSISGISEISISNSINGNGETKTLEIGEVYDIPNGTIYKNGTIVTNSGKVTMNGLTLTGSINFNDEGKISPAKNYYVKIADGTNNTFLYIVNADTYGEHTFYVKNTTSGKTEGVKLEIPSIYSGNVMLRLDIKDVPSDANLGLVMD